IREQPLQASIGRQSRINFHIRRIDGTGFSSELNSRSDGEIGADQTVLRALAGHRIDQPIEPFVPLESGALQRQILFGSVKQFRLRKRHRALSFVNHSRRCQSNMAAESSSLAVSPKGQDSVEMSHSLTLFQLAVARCRASVVVERRSCDNLKTYSIKLCGG